MASSMYAKVELNERAVDLREASDKNVGLARRRVNKNYYRRSRSAPIFRVGNYIFVDRYPLLRTDAELSASEVDRKLLLLLR